MSTGSGTRPAGGEGGAPGHRMAGRRRTLWFGVSILAAGLLIGVVIWLLQLHGTFGLYRATWIMPAIFGTFIAVAIALPFLIILDGRLRRPSRGITRPALPATILIAGSLLVPLAVFGYLGITPAVRMADKPPQLLLADGQGVGGVPNLAATWWTKAATVGKLTWTGSGGGIISDVSAAQVHALPFTGLTPAAVHASTSTRS